MYVYATAKYEEGCHDLVDLIGKVKSVDTFGKCVRVFASRGCTGWSLAIYPGSGSSHYALNSILTVIGSVGPCLSNEFIGASLGSQVLGVDTPVEKHSVPDLLEFFSIQKYQSLNGTFILGPHNRVEFVRVMSSRKQFPESPSELGIEKKESYLSLGKKETDVVGYLYPLGLGGSVNDTRNIFSQSPSGRDAWLQATSDIRPYLERAESKWVKLRMNLMYENDESTRPYAFSYYINYDQKRISYGYIQN
ncbi:unnamed protein product [Allacma fusca]|uniref:Uncharacterized protein n=1 Tax=Allacma fusca TaxID=39272 RepID=A0A8J2M9L3_9HEXA|nr:unnamed protein product [Allacma fusca]